MTAQKSKFKLLIIFFSFFFLFFGLRFALAQIAVPVGPDIRSIVAIPPRLQLSADPGTTAWEVIKFRNNSDTEQTIKVTIKDFIVTDVKGTPVFVEEEVSGRWSLASWLTVKPSRVLVPPKETRSFTLTASIPLDALPGGHYAAVIYEPAEIGQVGRTGEGAQTGGAAIAGDVGTLVYLTVAGPITEDALVRRFEAPRFSEYGPIPFLTEIVNQSDVHIRPLGAIEITNVLNKKVASLELEDRNIFPGTSIIYQNLWDKKWLFGRYKAILNASYGEQGNVLTATIFFWVIPWKVVAAVALAIIILILLIILIRRLIKRRQEELEEKLAEEEKEVEELKEKLKKKGE